MKSKLDKYHVSVKEKVEGIGMTIAQIVCIEDVDTDFTDAIIGRSPKFGLVCLLVNQPKRLIGDQPAPQIIYMYLKSLRKLKALNLKSIETLYADK